MDSNANHDQERWQPPDIGLWWSLTLSLQEAPLEARFLALCCPLVGSGWLPRW